MKRVWIGVLLCAVLLCGCRRAESARIQNREEIPAAEQTPVSTIPEEADGSELAEECAEVYRVITEDLMFLISVEGTDGSSSALDMTPDNAATARGREAAFAMEFQWDEAEEEDAGARSEMVD